MPIETLKTQKTVLTSAFSETPRSKLELHIGNRKTEEDLNPITLDRDVELISLDCSVLEHSKVRDLNFLYQNAKAPAINTRNRFMSKTTTF